MAKGLYIRKKNNVKDYAWYLKNAVERKQITEEEANNTIKSARHLKIYSGSKVAKRNYTGETPDQYIYRN